MVAVTTAAVDDLTAPAAGAPARTGRRAAGRGLGRIVVLVLAGLYFIGPLAAAFWFSIHEGDKVSWHAYTHFVQAPGFAAALALSLELAVVTVLLSLLLMVPTMLVVHLRLPSWRWLVEVLCLLPLVIPPIVLVVGVSKVIAWGNDADPGSFTGQVFNQLLNSRPPAVLAVEYVILVLPFTYRSLDAGLRGSGITTLVEAGRNLGGSWPVVVWQIVLPTLRTAVLNAAFLAFALVLGEFTMASILQYQPFTVWLLQFQNNDGQLSVALSLISLLLTWGLLMVMAAVGGRSPRSRKESR
jgi:putative spermidine/putrescine transport system permease protein